MAGNKRPDVEQIDSGEVLIIGAGLAGLFTALKLAPLPVTVLAPAPLGDGSSSAWAQGGIAAAVEPGDTPEAHAADTIAAGAGIVDEDVAKLLGQEAPSRIEDLLRLGVPFDRDLAGKLSVGQEAAHSHRRIVRVRGDRAGAAIMAALAHAVQAAPSIRIIAGLSAYELALDGNRVCGVYALAEGNRPVLITARRVVLASGGAGQLYAVTTNPLQARGEGLGMSARAGAVIADAEFMQFHPTAIAGSRDPAPLVTEALRGEGATLINSVGHRFMPDIHPLAELAPRDIVARAIFREIEKGQRVFLDTRAAVGARMADAFPTVTENCLSMGIDPAREPIPVAPAAHYHMGGISTDKYGRSTLPGLWACGEVASTGAHGANRLASNSLLEAVVFGARIAEDIVGSIHAPIFSRAEVPEITNTGSIPHAALQSLRTCMSADVGVVRHAAGLRHALETIARLEEATGASRFSNLTIAARLIAASALTREESRGGHFRSDFPEPRDIWKHRSFITDKEATALTGDKDHRRQKAIP
jgi:L-aspartate oxidase